MKKQIVKKIKVLCVIFSTCFILTSKGMERPNLENTRLLIQNQTEYRIKITNPDIGVLTKGKEYLLTSMPDEIIFEAYGKAWGWVGSPLGAKTIKINDLISQKITSISSDDDLVLTISLDNRTWMGVRPWKFDLEVQPKAFTQFSLTAIPKSKDPWEIFPNVTYWASGNNPKEYARQLNNQRPKDLARYVLGLGEEYTSKQVNRRYKELNRLWHPDKHTENKEFATEVTKIIGEAKNILLDNQSEFSSSSFQ